MIETLLEALPALLVAVGNGCRKRKLPVGCELLFTAPMLS